MKLKLYCRSATAVALFAGMLAAVAAPANSNLTTVPTRKPNVVFILADDLGFADLSSTGSDLYQTPNIDAFGKASEYFSQAYAAPTCSPSRAAILSGKNPATLGIVGHGGLRSVTGGDATFLVSEEYTIAEALRDGGYTTCHIGKWHVGEKGKTGPSEQGFEEVIASNEFCCPGSYFYPFRDKKKTGPVAERSAVPDLADRKPGDHLTACLGDEAVKFINRHKDDTKPFFLNLWFYAVHTPIEAQPDKVAKYKKLVKPDARQRNPNYAGLVEHLDDSVGQVLRAIKENGLSDHTIIVFYSDNGGEIRKGVTSNNPLRAGKTTLYEGGVRVPLFINWPGVTQAGSVCDVPVIGQDLYPTLLKMTGVEGNTKQNAEMDGVNLVPLLKNPQATIQRDTFCWLRYGELVHYPTYKNDETFGPSAAIRKGDWKMIEHYPTPAGLERRFELFNLKSDVAEANNLAATHPEKLTELQRALAQWQREIKIPTYEEIAYPEFEKVK